MHFSPTKAILVCSVFWTFQTQASQQEPVIDADFGASTEGFVQQYSAAPQIENYVRLVHSAYKSSFELAEQMLGDITAFVDHPTELSLAKAKFAWLNARVPYLKTEAFRFYEGPIDHGPDDSGEAGPEGRMNAWPINEAVIDYVEGNLNAGIINDSSIEISRREIIVRDQVSDETNVTTGWHAIEFLLWGQDLSASTAGTRPASDFQGDEEASKRRRDYLVTVTQLLVDDLKNLVEDWDRKNKSSYANKFIALDNSAALSRILTGLATLAGFEMGNERLAAGLDSGHQEDEHSCFADNTRNDFIYDLKGIKSVYFGDANGENGTGLDELVAGLSPAVHIKMMALLNNAENSLDALPLPYDGMLASKKGSPERMKGEAAYTALLALSDGIEQVGKLLGVKVITPTS